MDFVQYVFPEMQKAADAADIPVLFFSAGANFWVILGHFWAILAILGNFEPFLGYFGSFLGQFLVRIYLAKNVFLLFLLLFASLVETTLSLDLGKTMGYGSTGYHWTSG